MLFLKVFGRKLIFYFLWLHKYLKILFSHFERINFYALKADKIKKKMVVFYFSPSEYI